MQTANHHTMLKLFVILSTILTTIMEVHVNQGNLNLHAEILDNIIRHHSITAFEDFQNIARHSLNSEEVIDIGRSIFTRYLLIHAATNEMRSITKTLEEQWLEAELRLRLLIPRYDLKNLYWMSILVSFSLFRYTESHANIYITMVLFTLPLVVSHLVRHKHESPLEKSLRTLQYIHVD